MMVSQPMNYEHDEMWCLHFKGQDLGFAHQPHDPKMSWVASANLIGI